MSFDKYGISKRRLGTNVTNSKRAYSFAKRDLLGNVHIAAQDDTGFIGYYVTTGSINNMTSFVTFGKGDGASGSMYQSFDTDIDMRTIFDDSSAYANPRNNLFLLNDDGTFE